MSSSQAVEAKIIRVCRKEGCKRYGKWHEKNRLSRRGQMALPAEFRERLNLATDNVITASIVGDAIILTPQHLLGPGGA